MRTVLSIVVVLALVHTSCTAQHPSSVIRLDSGHVVLLLDSAAASKTILNDPIDRFFERVTPAEMSIQMRQPLDENMPDSVLRQRFREYLQADMSDFSAEDATYTARCMAQIYPVCLSFSSSIFPDTLWIIKTKIRHYGPGVWYTRMNGIVIPEDALADQNTTAFIRTLYHEISHIYSRLNPEMQEKMYRLIGFERLGYDQLQLPESLARRVLHNPDGVDFAQKISLRMSDGATIEAIPVITANEDGYVEGKKEFFAYLNFQLYQIELQEDGKWKVVTDSDGVSSTLNLRELPDFFRQIRDNTNYIIHPDEVMADNFSFLMNAQKNPSSLDRFSPEGRELLQSLEKLLRQE